MLRPTAQLAAARSSDQTDMPHGVPSIVTRDMSFMMDGYDAPFDLMWVHIQAEHRNCTGVSCSMLHSFMTRAILMLDMERDLVTVRDW